MVDDEDLNLTEVFIYPEVANVTHTRTGWELDIYGVASTGYESGTHGDRQLNVIYVVNETAVRRVPSDGHPTDIDPSAGTVLLDCQA